jgi:hypothetical protein
MPYVSIKPGSGMGNQLFQVAALLGYAERYGHTPVFVEYPMPSKDHPDTAFRPHLWSRIPVRTELQQESNSWCTISLRTFTFEVPPFHAGNVMLEGYAQSEAYGPMKTKLPTLSSSLSAAMIPLPWQSMFFLHVRRGDYLHPANAHHVVDLRRYYKNCLQKLPAKYKCFVVSDDMEWCRSNLPSLDPQRQWIWCPTTLADTEVLFWMAACERGGICGNSTFSWWAAKFGWDARKKGQYFMPATWGHGPTFANTLDLYPPWAIVSSV